MADQGRELVARTLEHSEKEIGVITGLEEGTGDDKDAIDVLVGVLAKDCDRILSQELKILLDQSPAI
jgi:hypothetical protein